MDKDIEEVIYKKGRRVGAIIGATISLLMVSMAYIVTQGVFHFWR